LACISNDPSFELNPLLGKSINLDAFEPLIKISKDSGVSRFIYASSSSVYGIKEDMNVTEDVLLEPITDYSKFKALCEEICIKYSSKDFITTIIRPATVCGFSKRQRFDLVVNILTNLGINTGQITVFGGKQLRPNIHINDMVDAYLNVLGQEEKKVNTKIYNVGYENQPVIELANLVKKNIEQKVEIIQTETNDNRSYHISSQKIKNELGFANKYSIEDAIIGIKEAFKRNEFVDSLKNDNYFNVKMMKKINLK
jgi:nucleoside-diphosphate-sugar epimerase